MERLKLYIKRQDLSVYWVEYFSSISDLNRWLDEEKTRPYWDTTYVCSIFVLDDQNNETEYVG